MRALGYSDVREKQGADAAQGPEMLSCGRIVEDRRLRRYIGIAGGDDAGSQAE